jgi:selenocysteine lyase/cysteine desulfurase
MSVQLPAYAAFKDAALDVIELQASMLDADPDQAARDEDFWHEIRSAFTLHPGLVNLNNGGCSPSPRVVTESLKRQIDYANLGPSIYMWRTLDPEIEKVRSRLAKLLRADPEEIAITRNASESLITCLLGLPMTSGDELLTSSQDYPRMINTILQMEKRHGIKLVRVDIPLAPQTAQEVVAAFERGITSRTRMILTSHVSFMTGEIYPIKEICALGAARGIPVVVDGAHAVAHFDFSLDDIGCEYYGTSLHKWLMAPVGTGMLFVKKPCIEPLWALMPNEVSQYGDIRKFEEIGTHQAGVHNAIAEALDFHEMLGFERKSARLHYLKTRWARQVADAPKVRFHTNLDAGHSGGICTVEVEGISAPDLATWLETEHRIVVAPIETPQFQGLRVSPQVYTTSDEVDRFGEAIREAAQYGIG